MCLTFKNYIFQEEWELHSLYTLKVFIQRGRKQHAYFAEAKHLSGVLN